MNDRLNMAVEDLRKFLNLPDTFESHRVVEVATDALREYYRYRNCPRDIEDRD